MLIDWVRSGLTGKDLALAHDARTSLHLFRTVMTSSQIHFPVRPSNSVNTEYILFPCVKISRFRAARAHLVFHWCLSHKSPYAIDVCHLPYNTQFLIFPFPLLSSGLPVKAGKPTKDELEALSLKIGDKWERLGRRLGFDEADLVAFDEDNRQLTKKAYRMLMAWKGKEGSKGTYLVLYNALCHKFVGRKDLAEAFCCEKIEGNGSN